MAFPQMSSRQKFGAFLWCLPARSEAHLAPFRKCKGYFVLSCYGRHEFLTRVSIVPAVDFGFMRKCWSSDPVAEMRRREFIVGVGGAAAAAVTWPIGARAQQSGKILVMGVLWHAENAEGEVGHVEALRDGLKDLGRIDGKNIKIINTFAAEQYERFDTNVADLMAVPVDLLFAHTQPARSRLTARQTRFRSFSPGCPTRCRLVLWQASIGRAATSPAFRMSLSISAAKNCR